MKILAGIAGFKREHFTAKVFQVLGLALILALSGCGESATTGPEADKLRKDMNQILGELGKKVEPLLDGYDLAGIDRLLREKYDAAAKAGKPLTYAMAVLSDQGKVLSGRHPTTEGKLHRKSRKGMNFGRYDSFKKVLDGKSSSCLLYIPRGIMYGVCTPLRKKRSVIGMVCVGYPEDEFKQKYKLDQDQFLAMSFK